MPVSGPTSSIPEVDAPRQTAGCLPGVSPQRSVQAGLATTSLVGRGKEKEKKKTASSKSKSFSYGGEKMPISGKKMVSKQ